MKAELDQRLCEQFPLLYSDRGKSMRETSMCWGFSCDDGWYALLYDLSFKLEREIEKIKNENPASRCYRCGCKYLDHDSRMGMLCKKVHRLPYRLGPNWSSCQITTFRRDLKNAWLGKAWWYGDKIPSRPRRLWQMFWKNLKVDWKWTKHRWVVLGLYRRVNRLLALLYDKFDLHWKKPCHCNEYEASYPRAIQVKEKFGTLRFYMSSYPDKISEYINIAEQKSAKICEKCGQPGKLREGGWLRTLCNTCDKERDR